MKEFFQKNGHLIWRLILNQIGLTIFGLMTSMTAAAVGDMFRDSSGNAQRIYMVWTSVFAIVFYMFVDYTAIKEEGQRDKIRVDAGRVERDSWRGFKIAACASALNFLLAIVINVCGLLGSEKFLALEWAGDACGISKLLALVLQAMYWGVLVGLPGVTTVSDIPALLYFVIPLPALIVASLGYLAGLKDVSLIRRIKGFFIPEESEQSQNKK